MLLLVLFGRFFSKCDANPRVYLERNDRRERRCLKYAPDRYGGDGRNSASDKADRNGQKDERND